MNNIIYLLSSLSTRLQ